MKTITSFIALSLIFLLVITGCGSKTTTGAKPEAAAAQIAQTDNKNISEDSLKTGLATFLRTAKQLRKAATAGDEAKVKEYGPKLEEQWSSIEDAIKSKYPEIYERVEKNLDPTIAGAKASPLDKDTVLKLDNQLIQVLYDLSQKLIPVDLIKTGAAQMISITNDLKKEINAANEAKVKEIGPQLEETWKKFEDGVKPRNADLYEKIEKSLNPEVAGSQKSPLDKQALTQLNDGLAQALNELLQNLK